MKYRPVDCAKAYPHLEETFDSYRKVRLEMLNRRVSVPAMTILFCHLKDADSSDIIVWARLIRKDGSEGHTALSVTDAAVIAAIHEPWVCIWLTKIGKAYTIPTEAIMQADEILYRRLNPFGRFLPPNQDLDLN